MYLTFATHETFHFRVDIYHKCTICTMIRYTATALRYLRDSGQHGKEAVRLNEWGVHEIWEVVSCLYVYIDGFEHLD